MCGSESTDDREFAEDLSALITAGLVDAVSAEGQFELAPTAAGARALASAEDEA